MEENNLSNDQQMLDTRNPLTNKDKWNEASKAGIILGLIVLGYSLAQYALTPLAGHGAALAFTKSVLQFLIWLAKFVGCIMAMRFFMKQLCRKYKDVTNKDTFSFGNATAVLSALVCAAISLVQALTTSKEEIADAIQQAMSNMHSLDANSQAVIDTMLENIPQLMFFSTFIYCYLFGLVLSLILSRNIPSQNPFERD